jgi:hypothetical protein
MLIHQERNRYHVPRVPSDHRRIHPERQRLLKDRYVVRRSPGLKSAILPTLLEPDDERL